MVIAVAATYLIVILGLFSQSLQSWLKARFAAAPSGIWIVPAALAVWFAAVLAFVGAFSPAAVGLIAAYAVLPVLLVRLGRKPGDSAPRTADFAAILALWLPVEFYTGKELIPRHAWGVANVAAHGTAVVLGLFLFLIYRDLKGIKYNLPRRAADFWNPVLGFAIGTVALAPLGLALGFMSPFRVQSPFDAAGFGILYLKTLLGVALPEEILFRGLIQNWLMQRFGESNRTLLGASVIFGISHVNNAPAPNWPYVLLATIAGLIYGKVFQRSATIWSSAALHSAVNTVRHTFFR